MPIFIREVLFRGVVADNSKEAPNSLSTDASSTKNNDAVATKAAQIVFDHLEREIDRIGDR